MGTSSAQFLPPLYSTMSTAVTSNVDIFHLFTNAVSKEFHDVEGGKFCSHVVSVVDSVAWKVTGCPPMCGN